jgi:hypothetical protein
VTLVEFVYPIRNGKHRDLVLAVLYYFKKFRQAEGMTAADIRAALLQAKVPGAKKINVNHVINTSAPYVHSPGGKASGAFIFELTDSGEKYVREKLELNVLEPDVKHDVAGLRHLADHIGNAEVRGYIEEAITCLSVGALRATVVFLWTGAMRALQDKALTKGESAVNAALARQDNNARKIKRVEDFAYVKDRTFLEATPDISILDKGQKETLVDALNLRNKCGHPTKYQPGVQKVRGFIEDVVGIVFA